MTPTATVLQHVACEGPGAIGDALQRYGVAQRVVRIYDGEPVPTALEGDALIVMGGPMGVYETDRFPHLRAELRLIDEALRRGRPTLGVCLGSQLIAAALGARVYPSGGKEIGWYPIELSDAAKADAVLGAAPRRFTAFVWHGDVFDLPRGAVHLASTEMTAEHAFRYGEQVYGLLFHLEVTPVQVDAMLRAFADELAGAGIAPDPIRARAPLHLPALGDIAAPAFDAFAAKIAVAR
jgi:GMP synthase (glutamine-hydrolysing)